MGRCWALRGPGSYSRCFQGHPSQVILAGPRTGYGGVPLWLAAVSWRELTFVTLGPIDWIEIAVQAS